MDKDKLEYVIRSMIDQANRQRRTASALAKLADEQRSTATALLGQAAKQQDLADAMAREACDVEEACKDALLIFRTITT